jgi:dihydroxyacid dehydratase/phosphogluconate dehydratase
MSDRSPAPRRSRLTLEGLERTSHRTFMRALGLDEAAMAKPFVGVMSTHGENTPCSLSLRPQAEAAKLGVAAAGGTPFEFTTISVSDGVSMGHRGMRMSLLSRELIADSIELVMRGHAYDALVGFAGCDKTLPGIMMGMVRLDCPSVFVYGGAMRPGQWHGRPVSAVTVYEGVGAVMAGAMTEADLQANDAPTVRVRPLPSEWRAAMATNPKHDVAMKVREGPRAPPLGPVRPAQRGSDRSLSARAAPSRRYSGSVLVEGTHNSSALIVSNRSGPN